MYFSQNIRYLCKINNITYIELAELFETNRQNIYSILSTNSPTAKTAIKMANIFDVSLDDLLLKDLSKK